MFAEIIHVEKELKRQIVIVPTSFIPLSVKRIEKVLIPLKK